LSSGDLTLTVGNDVIQPVMIVRDLGIYLDSELTMKHHISRVVSSCFFQLRRLRQIRRSAGEEVTKRLVTALILSRLDYCNAAYAGLPESTNRPLQPAQNAAARLVAGTRSRDHITPVLMRLHWLPIKSRIKYKLCLLMHLIILTSDLTTWLRWCNSLQQTRRGLGSGLPVNYYTRRQC
jgi:hypothetical protein